MNALTRSARWYIYGVWTTAVALTWIAASQPRREPLNLLLIVGALIAFVVADTAIVVYETDDGSQIAMTVVDALAIFLASTAGLYGLVVIVAGTIASDLQIRKPWYKAAFNGSERAIVYLVVLAIYQTLTLPGEPAFSGPRGLLAFVAMAVAYLTINSLIVSTVVALANGNSILRVYAQSFSTVQWVHFITLPFGAILAHLWHSNPWLLLPAVVPLYMAYRSFQTMASLREQSRRNQELATQATTLLEELRTKQDELLRSSRLAAIGTLSAGIGHEFNNLLTAIYGNAQLGLATDDVAEKDESLEVVLHASLRGRSITSGLLNFARRSEPRRESVNLAAVVQETVALVQPEFGRLNIAIEQHLAPVPPVTCDSGQIAQVLMNLLTNARDAMTDRAGGAIVIDLREHQGFVELAVTDCGSGIPAELLPHIFEPFTTTKRAYDRGGTTGTGLGLAISHGIVESHAGSIMVHSTLGEGTTMTVRLPLDVEGGPPQTQPADEPAPSLEIRAIG